MSVEASWESLISWYRIPSCFRCKSRNFNQTKWNYDENENESVVGVANQLSLYKYSIILLIISHW